MLRTRTLRFFVLLLLACFPTAGLARTVTEIIFGNTLVGPVGIAVDDLGNAYVTGRFSDNAFKITPDEDGDGVPNEIDVCPSNTLGLPVACDGRPLSDCNGDCLFDGDDIQCIVDELLNQ
ncbi:MAG: SBBP repeat-containing protein [Planctomycetes bacterium]|nr:SBBP repeat-containing protein [Planctomycetota bacterium]